MEDRLLNFKIYGDNRQHVVVIAHGLFGMLDNWQTFAKKLADDFMVISIDLRNHGRSFHHADMSYEAMAEDVMDLLSALAIEKATFIGHSMGGKMAAQLALMHPEVVEALVVIDILPITYDNRHSLVFRALEQVDLEAMTTRSEVEAAMVDALEGDRGVALFLMKNLKRKKSGGFEWRFNLPVLHTTYDEIRGGLDSNASFDGATLFVKGGLSNYVTPDGWLRTTELFPSAHLTEIERAGHWVHVDRGEGLLEAILSFLDEYL